MMPLASFSQLRNRLRPTAGRLRGAAAAGRPPQQDDWSSLVEPILVLVLGHLEGGDLTAARLVSRAWRDAGRLVVRRLCFRDKPPNTAVLKQVGPSSSHQCH